MNQALTIPPGDDQFADLPVPVREEIRAWVRAFRSVPLVRPLSRAFEQIGRMINKDIKTVERKYYAIKAGADWRIFVDNRRTAPAARSRVKDPRFQAFIKKMFEDHKRSSASAIAELYSLWRKRATIPGYEGWPGWPNLPDGWGERNLYRQQPSKTELKVFRIGMSAAHAGLPQTFSTRVGLWPMSHVMFDDVWHDNFVRVGTKGAVGRVLELGALDVFSGYKIAWGCKPRLPKVLQPDVMENLNGKNMRLLLASMFFSTGYSPRGTVLMAELGTAAVSGDMEQILHDATGGLITTRRSVITGHEQAILASWKGEAKGNPRFKSPLESLHNLIHNRLDALPAQTGRNRDARPEILSAVLDYQQELMELSAKLPEHRRELLIHPILEFHTQFLPLLGDLYTELNARENHSLEGWEKCGHLTTVYRLTPQSNDWLSGKDYLALDDTSRNLLAAAVRSQPKQYSRTRRLQPVEVFNPCRGELLKIGPEVICDLLLEDLGREEKVKGSYFRFDDIEIDPEELIFEARILAPGSTRERELPEGERYLVFVNPMDPDWLFVCDARKTFLGLAQRVQRVNPLDDRARLAAFGRSHERTADRLAPARMRHQSDQDEHRTMIENNDRVKSANTPADKAERRDANSSLLRRAQKIRAQSEV